jgi:DNA-binding PadR family transcriptional regulator
VALKHAILSALSRGVPLNGYALVTVFSNETERLWHASASQVYSELIKMEKAGLIEIASRNELGHTTYVITEVGRREIEHWLTLTDPDHSIRDDSMLRFMALWVVDDTTARHLIQAEQSFQRKRLLRLREVLDEFRTKGEQQDARAWRDRQAVYVLWIVQAEAMIAWLERLPDVFEHPERSVAEIFANSLREPVAAGR